MASLVRPYLAQARHLALLDIRRPQQANLRSALSRAYYAIFHFMTEETNRFLLGTTSRREGLRNLLGRAFTHTEMATASRTFAGGNLPAGILNRVGAMLIPPGLRQLALTFIEAQENRNLAEYDSGEEFARDTVLQLITRIETVVDNWPTIRDEPAAELFLLGQLVWSRLRDR